MTDKEKRTPISELGEFGLIDHLTSKIRIKNKSTKKGVGDDAAVIDHGKDQIVVTSDILLEGIHFNLIYTPLKHLGYKAAVINFSDIYAMNSNPTQLIISLGISGKFVVEDIDLIYEGLYLACDNYDVDLVGGDTSSSLTGLTISITAIGYASEKDIVYRDSARINDIICVTGDLGAAYLGLQLLEREKKIFAEVHGAQPDLGNYEYVLRRQLKPEPRADVIKKLKEEKVRPSSMIDISDGLSSEILHICKSSGLGCKIYNEKIPLDKETEKLAKEFQIDPITAALNGGEDYELLFTVPLEDFEKIKGISFIHPIGHITEKSQGCNLITPDGVSVNIKAQGWNGFLEKW